MKKLLLTLFCVLNTSQLYPIIWAMQEWIHPDGRTIELYPDIHMNRSRWRMYKDWYFNPDTIVTKQQKDIIDRAQAHKDTVVIIEDPIDYLDSSFPTNIPPNPQITRLLFHIFRAPETVLMAHTLRKNNISCVNVECRKNEIASTEAVKEITSYDDGPHLNIFYADLKRSSYQDDYVIESRAIHNAITLPHKHKMIVMGTDHIQRVATALAWNGFTLKQHHLNPETTEIMNLEIGQDLKEYVHHFSSPHLRDSIEQLKQVEKLAKEIDTMKSALSKTQSPSDNTNASSTLKELDQKFHDLLKQLKPATDIRTWNHIFLRSHPIDIAAITEQEEKEQNAQLRARL